MTDFPDYNNDPSFRGEGKGNPPPRPAPKPPPITSFPLLNIGRGSRIRVLEDNGKRGIVGYEGTVIQSFPGSVVVELDNDPMMKFRAAMPGGFANPTRPPLRHFRVFEVEKID